MFDKSNSFQMGFIKASIFYIIFFVVRELNECLNGKFVMKMLKLGWYKIDDVMNV